MKLSKNPTYVCKYPLWKKLYDCYTADRDVIVQEKYLWPHQQEKTQGSEGHALRLAREMRTRYLNLPELVVSLWISFFLRDKPSIGKNVIKLLEVGNAQNNIDGFGTTVEQFMKNVLQSFLIYGKSTILVDAMPFKAASRLAEQKMGLRPFMSLIQPLDLVDWSLNTSDPEFVGSFDFLRYNYIHMPARKRAKEAPEMIEMSDELFLDNGKFCIQRWKKEKQQTIDPATTTSAMATLNPSQQWEDGEWTEEGTPVVTEFTDRIPVVEICDESWLKDVNEESLRYYNLRSVNDSVLLHQCYQKVFITGVESSSDAERKELTEYLIPLLPKDANVLSIDPVDTSSLEVAMDASLAATLKIALNQLRALPADSRAVQGVDTISEEKDNMSALVESTLTEIENVMNQALVFYAEYAGVKKFKDKIELNKEVKQEDVDQFIEVWNTFASDLKQYPEITGEVLKKAVEKLKLPDDKTDKFKTLIDKQPPENRDQPEVEQFDENGEPITEPKSKKKGKGKKPKPEQTEEKIAA